MKHTSFQEHRELGNIVWLRDYDAALSVAAKQRKPILLLFQEIPGCSTCVNFGQDVLSHPLLAELIEDRFVPVAIHNNKPGRDAEILARFNEPAWNNPVVYFLSPDGQPIVPKLANRYDPLGLYEKIHVVLRTLELDVPEYFKILRDDLLVEYSLAETAIFETPCFWSGETSLAQNPAVMTTEAGWIGREEVVRVNFDSSVATRDTLDRFAVEEGFAPTAKTGFRSDKAPQYYLSKTRFAFLPLTPVQRTKINLAIAYRDNPERFLSPQQADFFARPDIMSISRSDAYRSVPLGRFFEKKKAEKV